MRIFIGEKDRVESGPYKGKPLYEGLLLTLRERGFAGATVTRGIAGFGASARLHTDRVLRMSADLPIIVEAVAKEEMIDAIRPELNQLIGGGLVTLEKVRVILYRPADLERDERWEHRIEGLEAVEDPPDGD